MFLLNKEKLILGIFRPIDLVIFISGLCISILLIIVFSSMENTNLMIIAPIPVLICTFLVMPIKKHHNVLCAIKELLKK